MAYTVTIPTDYLQAVYNPINLEAVKTDYQVGQYFYCEVWVTPNKNMQVGTNPISGATMLVSLQKAGTVATKSATFDISNVLASVFTASNYQVPNVQQRIQKDETGYVQWFVRMGWIAYNTQNVAVKTEEFVSSGSNFAVRAAITGPDGAMDSYLNKYDYVNNSLSQYATLIPNGAKRSTSEHTFLSFFTPIIPGTTGRILLLEADLEFADGTSQTNFQVATHPLDTGGLYIINVKPDIFITHLKFNDIVSYQVRIKYYDDQTPLQLVFTEDRGFQIKKDIPNPITVTFMNSLGGWDAIYFRKDYDTATKAKSSLFKNTYAQKVYAADGSKTISYQSSYLSSSEYSWLEDLRYSIAIYVNNKYVRQADGDYKNDTSVGLFTYELVVNPDYDRNSIRF
jgi:hypothetical protein